MKLFRKTWIKIVYLLLFLFLCLFLSPILNVNAAETDKDRDKEAVREVIKRHYEILSGDNLSELVAYKAIPREHILTILAARKLGMKEYQNIELPYIDRLETDKTVWIVHTSYELSVEGLPSLPGSECLIVRKEKEEFRIVRDYMEELQEEVVDELIKKVTRREVMEFYLQITSQYEELTEEHGEVIDWVNLCRNEEKNIYVVQAGDCLWKIAGQCCGDEARWEELYEQNKNVIGDDPSLIYPGQILYIGTRKAK